MRFFVPHAQNSEEAESVWRSVRAFLEQQMRPTTPRRIWKVAFRHNSKPYELEVGKRHPDLGEDVLMIFRAAGYELYYACTENRGVVRGEPYLVGIDHHTSAVDFED